MTTIVDITDARAGDSLALSFTVNDGDGNAIDLTGASVQWGFKRPPLDGVCPPLITKSNGSEGGLTISGDGNNVVNVYVADGELPAGSFIHMLKVKPQSGASFTPAMGLLEVIGSVFLST